MLSERANTGYMDGFFSLPAGHVDGGETIWNAMKREVSEEVGISLDQEIDPVHVMHRIHKDHERIDYFFAITNWKGKPHNTEPEKCRQLKWFSLTQLPEKTVPYIRFAIEQYLQHKTWSEFSE